MYKLQKYYCIVIVIIALTLISCNNSPKDLSEGIELGDNVSELEESGKVIKNSEFFYYSLKDSTFLGEKFQRLYVEANDSGKVKNLVGEIFDVTSDELTQKVATLKNGLSKIYGSAKEEQFTFVRDGNHIGLGLVSVMSYRWEKEGIKVLMFSVNQETQNYIRLQIGDIKTAEDFYNLYKKQKEEDSTK